MTQSRFFQLSLFFPFAVWCLYLIISSLRDDRGFDFITANVLGAYPIFVPYFIFAVILWKWADKKSYRQLVVIAMLAPILWGFFYTFSHMVQYYIKKQVIEQLSILLIMIFWSTVAGYIVEIIPLTVLTIFKDDLKSS